MDSNCNTAKSRSKMRGIGRPIGRGTKRKVVGAVDADGVSSKKPKSDLVMPKLPANGYPTEHPFNKDGFQYILAEPDPHAPFRQEFDESQDWAGKPIPGWLYRKLSPTSVLVAMHDRAPQLRVSEERLSVTGEKGYCMARATHGVHYGSWYYEVNIVDMPEGSATRIGWSQELGNLQGPCGYDKFSYSWRSRKGTRFHQSKGYHYADSGYGTGDTVGCLINLSADEKNPKSANNPNYLPSTHKDRPLIKFKNYLYFEEKDDVQKAIKQLQELEGSSMVFYKNGKNIGVAFENLISGVYYPAVSFYKSVTVTFNFGPNFKYPPQDALFRGVYELAEDAAVRQTLSDLVYFTENEGKLRLDTFYYGTSGNPM
ncbi:set1/Ash2 histone methyltransferase complex subunit ASH2-like protein [Dinothrombium tinctorium]|uniref:Set1/Ash2 histone methyltransferase complex subunit ASH2-like protein n=1 Tax=Dinothrombium tinctorium TaxID=1965070 RepID=A0A3S3QW76_9ACAR|nr:set1/Ash2 histone methyltransferase complex subunit ASH2-like protein [Dinothrombium tinctorium]RWS12435.1 set1/Ash2 histone methyltransferase complex subunit ASH2-like protein [Dinothrombium tinctorium]RWS14977.1 set1/Ash2 histone methyltransferase complex subunit ASH2-like protein [Dinothrombium tinctorium]